MAWINYRKAHMLPHSWIIEMLETMEVADSMKGLLCGSMSD